MGRYGALGRCATQGCTPVCPDMLGWACLLSLSQVFRDPAHCGDSCFTPETAWLALAQAQGSPATPPDLERGAALQREPWQEGAGDWGTGASHSPALQAPQAPLVSPALELTLKDVRNLESPLRHQLPAAAGLPGVWGGEGSTCSEMFHLSHLFLVCPTQVEPPYLLPALSTQNHLSFMSVLGSPPPQTLPCSQCKASRVPAWHSAMLERCQQTQHFGRAWL